MIRALVLTVLVVIIVKAAYEVWYADNGAKVSRMTHVMLSHHE